jgi:hypothetical protein
MENKLSLFQGITNPIEAAHQLGEAFAASGLFGCSRPQQGTVLAMQCLATGMSPFELTQTYHIIDGKLSMKADAMLGRFLSAGGKAVWGARTAEKVSARFIYRDNDLEMSVSMQELIASGVALSKGDQLKDNYRRHPRQMLTARLISEAVRLLAPEIVAGVYTPEEIGDFATESTPPNPVPPKPEPPKAEPETKPKPTKTKAPTIETTAEIIPDSSFAPFSRSFSSQPVAADPEDEWKQILGEHYKLALDFFHATGVLKDAQKLQHLPDSYKSATRTRTADLIAKITKK